MGGLWYPSLSRKQFATLYPPAAVAYAALLHDTGKIAVNLHVDLVDGSIWYPWHGSLHPYRVHYR